MVVRLIRTFVLHYLRYNILFMAEQVLGINNDIVVHYLDFKRAGWGRWLQRVNLESQVLLAVLWNLDIERSTGQFRLHYFQVLELLIKGTCQNLSGFRKLRI